MAAALFARSSFEGTLRRAADQRGITLQTLIVTAVLVLMVVAAGVAIVAIANSAQPIPFCFKPFCSSLPFQPALPN